MDEQVNGAKRGRSTIRDVAADAGVSVAAVSKVLRNAYGVSDALRQNVLSSIEKLGYRPSTAARGMRGRTFTIGVLLVEIGNPFLPEVIAGASEVCAAEGYKALIGIGGATLTLEVSLIESMMDHGMDGLVLVAPRMSGDVLQTYAKLIPITAIAHHEATATTFDTINCDDLAGAALAVDALAAQGFSDIAMVSPLYEDFAESHMESHVATLREAGYVSQMTKLGLSDRIRILRTPPRGPERITALTAMLDMPDRPRALFCWSDIDGTALVDIARAKGIRIPQDLAMIGFDNTPQSGTNLIALSSIDQSPRELGAEAVRALLSRIGGRTQPIHHLTKPSLASRTSHLAEPCAQS